ncbi:kelch-like protein 41 [Physella acuta]|uniref:kelch-like protein 41 n=1 Tax=Physella acuta TaxID=109671 RepID=UPI0027DE671B|nr:kelch-like protein 41 [Physella acuta]XP_059170029.1 kelch-like protein 41 [Physella acuta]
MTTPEVCTQIVKCLQDVWTDKMLFDFAVKICDETIQCHRLILAACSDFFKALFRSGMREVTENCVVLQDVSCDVFQLILKTVYTGENTLTLVNLFEVWRAVNRLQITFMIDLCENFAIKAINIDTWENIYSNAKMFDSEKVIKQLHIFMLKNVDQICLSSTFLQLSFNEVRDLIKSPELNVVCEDVVLESVIRWVKQVPYHELYTYDCLSAHCISEPNRNNTVTETAVVEKRQGEVTEVLDELKHDSVKDVNPIIAETNENNDSIRDKLLEKKDDHLERKQHLSELVKLVRTCLVSPAVLARVYKMEMIYENNVLRDIMFNASHYVQNFRHGQWPTAAVHRACSEYINAAVFEQRCGGFSVLDILENKWLTVSRCEYLQENIQLASFDSELYASGKQQNQPNEPCKLFVFCDNNWVEVVKMPGQNLLLLSHEQFIYILNKDNKVIHRVNPKKKIPIVEKFTDFPENAEVKHAMIYEKYFLIFCSETHNGNHETSVHKLDISSKIWTKLDNLDGSAEHIISFRNDKHSYVLQSNGSLWCILHVPSSLNIKLNFVFKLWSSQKKLYGAYTYNGKLCVMGNFTEHVQAGHFRKYTVPEHIQSVFYWRNDNQCSNLIPITMLKIH